MNENDGTKIKNENDNNEANNENENEGKAKNENECETKNEQRGSKTMSQVNADEIKDEAQQRDAKTDDKTKRKDISSIGRTRTENNESEKSETEEESDQDDEEVTEDDDKDEDEDGVKNETNDEETDESSDTTDTSDDEETGSDSSSDSSSEKKKKKKKKTKKKKEKSKKEKVRRGGGTSLGRATSALKYLKFEPPKFRPGKDSWRLFEMQFQARFADEAEKDQKVLLSNLCEGSAGQDVMRLMRKKKSVRSIMKKLRKMYGVGDFKLAWSELKETTAAQQSDESIQDYRARFMDRVEAVAECGIALPKELQLELFLEGATHGADIARLNPKDVQDAVKKWQTASLLLNGNKNVGGRSSSSRAHWKPELYEAEKQTPRTDQAPRNEQPTGRNPSIKCWGCGETGHPHFLCRKAF
jgi:hypothetical protein